MKLPLSSKFQSDDVVPSSNIVRLPSKIEAVAPSYVPLSKSSPPIEIESRLEEAIGLLLTDIQPSTIVSFLGTLNAFVVTPSSSGLIGVVIVQFVTPALANGANIISITRAVASLRRLAGIALTSMVRLYTTRSLFYEQGKKRLKFRVIFN